MSIIIQMVVNILVQIAVWFITKAQPWYVCLLNCMRYYDMTMPVNTVNVPFVSRFEAFVPNEEEDYTCQEVTIITLVSNFQYITLAIVLSKSAPYRQTIFTNCKPLTKIILGLMYRMNL